MAYSLKPGISFCRASGRMIFLDLAADRYFCLSPDADQSLARLIDGIGLSAQDDAMLASLSQHGPLSADDGGRLPAPCPPAPPASDSLLDISGARPDRQQLAHAALCLAIVPIRLKLCGLAATIARLKSRKMRLRAATGEATRLAAAATAFAQLRYVVTAHDKCLPRSIAVAGRLLDLGLSPELVIAVRLQPFAAHAWVQCDGWLVNDRLDVVRDFTPILVV